MVFHCHSIFVISRSIMFEMWGWSYQDCFAFAFELDNDSGNGVFVCEAEDYLSTDEVEVGVEGVGII